MIISKSDIATYREISRSVADSKINPYIQDAEILDLKPLIGEKLYAAIVANPAEYADLLNKKAYNHDDVVVESPGLKRVLVDFAYARYMLHGSNTDTPFGLVQKDYEGSTAISRTEKKESYKHHQQIAMQYWREVETYLNRNVSLYPIWGEGCSVSTKRTFRFNHITR